MAYKAKEKPGVMVYWETFEALETLNGRQCAAFIRAMYRYARYEESPEFGGDKMLTMLWRMVFPDLDRDSQRYEQIRERRSASGKAGAKAKWDKETRDKAQQIPSVHDKDGNGWQKWPTSASASASTPASTPSSTPASVSASTQTSTSAAGALPAQGAEASPGLPAGKGERAAEPPVCVCAPRGAYGNVLLTQEQLTELQEEFPSDWQQRVEDLSEYMASTGKTYKNHLATLRAWSKKEMLTRTLQPPRPQRRGGSGNQLLEMIQSGVFDDDKQGNGTDFIFA